eukprot:TRINITY_DN2657_c0_g1_i1.p1 TRINITY_DN2657_c0_g1~~TRINITY_DN2657_c0_g1_i1.p1  ORF type:complete len:235 (+),score=47.11 TRINITY_DN2657_c0_g1_i1:130-834(+)
MEISTIAQKRPRKPRWGTQERDGQTVKVRPVKFDEQGKEIVYVPVPAQEEAQTKAKKKKKSKAKKRKVQVKTADASAALQYLQLWDSNRESWRFQKVRQVFLLKHMYDRQFLDKLHFQIMLRYVQSLSGRAVDETKQSAVRIKHKAAVAARRIRRVKALTSSTLTDAAAVAADNTAGAHTPGTPHVSATLPQHIQELINLPAEELDAMYTRQNVRWNRARKVIEVLGVDKPTIQ